MADTAEKTPLQELGDLARDAAQRARGRARHAEEVVREECRATRERLSATLPGRTVLKGADLFFNWLFDWGLGDDVPAVWSPPRQPTSKQIRAATDAAFAKKAAAEAAPEPEAQPEPATDTRPTPEPQDLDALADRDRAPSPPPAQAPRPPRPPRQMPRWRAERWCNCTGMAHEAHCSARARKGDGLQVDMPPAPPVGAV